MRLATILALVTVLSLRGAETAGNKLQESQAALERGDYISALNAASQAENLFRQAGDARGESRAVVQAGLAHLYRAEYAAALEKFEQALAIDRRTGNAESEITVRNNIGNVHFFQGRYLAALEAYQEALRRSEETAGHPWSVRRRQLTLVNLAVLHQQVGQNDRALAYYQRANIVPTQLPASEQAQLLSNLGTLYRRMKDPVRALETYREAERIFSGGKHADGEIHVLHNIGILMATDYRDLHRALGAFGQAIRVAARIGNQRQEILGYLFRGEALYREGRIADAWRDLERALAGAQRIGAVEETWTAQFGLGRIEERRGRTAAALGRYTEAIRNIESVRAGLRRASLKSEFLADKRDVYDAAISLLQQTGEPDVAALFGLIEQARARNLQDAFDPGAKSPAEIQARLPAGTLLVAYWMGADRGAALWMTARRAGFSPFRMTAGERRLVEQAAELGAGNREWRQWSRAAGSLLLGGLPLDGVNHIMIAPDGALHRVPFEALEAGGSLLVERGRVSYLPFASLLLRPPPRRGRIRGPWETEAALFGDPVITAGGKLIEGDRRWTPLPRAREELKTIARALPGRAQWFAANDDLKSRLRSPAVARSAVLHLATHAAVDLADAARSRILFTREAARAGSEYLFWSEAQRLDLKNTELVTISACDTEGGRLLRGEGVLSFSRAFLAAGAHSTVTTLWSVPDQPTAEFMRLFYHRLGNGDTKAAALRAAKLDFLRSGTELAEPRYWAPFVLNGDGLRALPPVVSWTALAAGAAAVLLCFAALRRLLTNRRNRHRLHGAVSLVAEQTHHLHRRGGDHADETPGLRRDAE